MSATPPPPGDTEVPEDTVPAVAPPVAPTVPPTLAPTVPTTVAATETPPKPMSPAKMNSQQREEDRLALERQLELLNEQFAAEKVILYTVS